MAWWNKDAQRRVSETSHILENVSLLDRATKRKPKARRLIREAHIRKRRSQAAPPPAS